MSALYSILDQIRHEAFSERAKGEKFEHLIKNYLLTEPLYNFEQVWLWIDTTNESFGKNAQQTTQNQSIGFQKIGLVELAQA